jgi:O-antigen chain-terminating methyltransferase
MTDQEQIVGAAVEDQRANVEPASEPEIDIQAIKSRIQQAVARRQAAGQTSFINASAELFELLLADDLAVGLPISDFSPNGELSLAPAEITRLALQPEFICRRDDHYHVNDLLKYHDHQFVWNAYRALLKREPDEEGLRTYLKNLRSGRFNKIDVLASLRFSPEGRRNAVTIDGLRTPAFIRRLYRLPILGYLMELTVGLARLPSLIRNQRRIEGYLVAQGERVATHFNNTSWALADQLSSLNQNLNQHVNQAHAQLSESFTHSISELATAQKAIARAQHQQVAALFREQQRASRDRSASQPETKSVPAASERRSILDELYAAFENQFRGSPEQIKEGLKIYLPLLKDAGITSDILDLGCGRGEWLELLREEGLRARGVESNRAMIDNRRGQNLEIVQTDAIAYLRGLPENSLRAVTAFHFVEHIGLEEQIDLLDEINRVLKPGGLLIVETPNPKNLVVGACNFYSDPTHHKPLFPETLQFILNHRGFVRTQLQYLHPVEGSPFQDGSEAAQALNSWLFSSRDFAIIAWRPSP